MTKKGFIVSCVILISVGAIILGYYIYNVLDTFNPTSDTSILPVEVDTSVDSAIASAPTEIISADPPKDVTWSETLLDQGDGYLLDPATGAVYTMDGEGIIYDDANNVLDDSTGQPMTN